MSATQAFPDGHELWMLAPLMACESPIEEQFLEATVEAGRRRRMVVVVLVGGRTYPVTETFEADGCLCVWSQPRMGKERFDFCLQLATSYGNHALVIECDGHDYHERTKEQAKRDRRRDRQVQEIGASVFRFTGSEIFQDAFACADQSLAFLVAKVQAGAGR